MANRKVNFILNIRDYFDPLDSLSLIDLDMI